MTSNKQHNTFFSNLCISIYMEKYFLFISVLHKYFYRIIYSHFDKKKKNAITYSSRKCEVNKHKLVRSYHKKLFFFFVFIFNYILTFDTLFINTEPKIFLIV